MLPVKTAAKRLPHETCVIVTPDSPSINFGLKTLSDERPPSMYESTLVRVSDVSWFYGETI